MADRRPEEPEMSRAKRPRTDDMDPKANPYLAHMYGESNGWGNGSNGAGSGFANFKRHHTTAAQAHVAEDGPSNPLNEKPLSKQYFSILKTRRNLPVHKQR